MRRRVLLNSVIVVVFFATACGNIHRDNAANQEENSTIAVVSDSDGPTSVFFAGKLGEEDKVEYTSITMDEAMKIFEQKGDYIILDVRRADEFAEGHIPSAINIANEDIGNSEISALPDKNQTIYVYCRSGNRSKKASAKLVDMGYTNIIEFGGIIDWKGEIEK